jgi:hypothetical protein
MIAFYIVGLSMNTSRNALFVDKRKYIMMSELIPGSQQPGIDIDPYFRPIVEDLKELWYNNRVQV